MNAGAFHLIAPPPPASNHPPLKEARSYPGFADPATSQCQLDYIDIPCDMALTMMSSGAGVPCPPEGCGPQVRGGKLQPLTVDPKTGKLVYGHWGDAGGGVITETDENGKPGEVLDTPSRHPEFVVDGVAVTTTFFVLNIGDTSRERLTDHGTPQKTTQPQKTPCDVQVPDVNAEPDQYALVNVLMHETTTPDSEGTHAYQDEDTYGHPTGPRIDAAELLREAHLTASAIVNYASNNHLSIYDTVKTSGLVSDATTDSKKWWGIGNDRITAAQQENGLNCARLKRAVDAATTNRDRLDPALYQRWLGRVQFHKHGRPTINNTGGHITAANTIFRF